MVLVCSPVPEAGTIVPFVSVPGPGRLKRSGRPSGHCPSRSRGSTAASGVVPQVDGFLVSVLLVKAALKDRTLGFSSTQEYARLGMICSSASQLQAEHVRPATMNGSPVWGGCSFGLPCLSRRVFSQVDDRSRPLNDLLRLLESSSLFVAWR